MFAKTKAFNQDISAWDLSSVTDMTQMFDSAVAFNQNLCPWASNSPQLSNAHQAFWPPNFCPNNTEDTPILRSGTPENPHLGPFCYAC